MKYGRIFLALTVIVAGLLAISCGDADDGETLTMLYWQRPTIANPYLAGANTDQDASALILEPLANYDEKGNLVPRLAEEIPTVKNGGVSEDATTITWKLKEGILWSDGTPLTVEDVIFTHEYACSLESSPPPGCDLIQSVKPVDNMPHHTKITFTAPVVYPYTLFVGASSPILQKAQFANCIGEAAQGCRTENLYPVGTGPYKITDFALNEDEKTSVLTYEANEYFHAPEKLFSKVIIKGGGRDAFAAARAVLETGEADYGWNLQIEPQTLKALEDGGKGTVVTAFAADVESLVVNFTNPDPDLGDRRSEWLDGGNPHPFLTDPDVRKALSLAIDRDHIAKQLYGFAGRATCNIIPTPSQYVSPNNDECLTQNIEEAITLLDKANWTPGDDGIREKDGVRLKILYKTTADNSVRQMTQELIKQWWLEIGVETELKGVADFFGSTNPDNIWRFYSDIEMYTDGPSSTDPQDHLSQWQTTEITGPENDWMGGNIPRWFNEEYDDLYQKLTRTPLGTERENLVIAFGIIYITTQIPLYSYQVREAK